MNQETNAKMATMETHPQETLVLQGLEVARRAFEASGQCPETLVCLRAGAADFDNPRVLETPKDYPAVATACGAHAILLFGSLTEANLEDATAPVHTIHAALIYSTGDVGMSGTQYARREGDSLAWSVPRVESGPFKAKGPGWIPQE